MIKNIIFPSLFPYSKGDFNYHEFEALIKREPDFVEWLKVSFVSAHKQLNAIEIPMSKRLKSTNLHEFIFSELENNLSSFYNISNKISMYSSIAGNQKNYFNFDDYIFVLKKEDASENATTITKSIKNQKAASHIITVEYTISQMYDSITSLKLSYIVGDTHEYSYEISLSSSNEQAYNDIEEQSDIVPTKPKLAKRISKNNAVS